MAALCRFGPASSEVAMRANVLEHRQIERWRPPFPFPWRGSRMVVSGGAAAQQVAHVELQHRQK